MTNPNDHLTLISSKASNPKISQSTTRMCPNWMSLAAPSPNALGPR